MMSNEMAQLPTSQTEVKPREPFTPWAQRKRIAKYRFFKKDNELRINWQPYRSINFIKLIGGTRLVT